MKLNCDMGESLGVDTINQDADIMPYVHQTNIACGFHASDPQVMQATITLAVQNKVSIGAHPSYPDRENFGRQPMALNEQEIINIVHYQVGALKALCHAQGAKVDYVKPHGALYNTMMQDESVFIALLKAVSTFSPTLPLMVMANSQREHYLSLAKKFNVPLIFEAFCDRAYTDDGQLQKRSEEGAVHNSLDKIIQQATQLIESKSVTTVFGKVLNLQADTLCIHGDTNLAVDSVKAIRSLLEREM